MDDYTGVRVPTSRLCILYPLPSGEPAGRSHGARRSCSRGRACSGIEATGCRSTFPNLRARTMTASGRGDSHEWPPSRRMAGSPRPGRCRLRPATDGIGACKACRKGCAGQTHEDRAPRDRSRLMQSSMCGSMQSIAHLPFRAAIMRRFAAARICLFYRKLYRRTRACRRNGAIGLPDVDAW